MWDRRTGGQVDGWTGEKTRMKKKKKKKKKKLPPPPPF
jgi:hypothetical protein